MWGDLRRARVPSSPTYNTTTVNPALLPVGSFAHVTLPLASFTGGSTRDLTLASVPFYVFASGGSGSGALFTLDNVRWTAD